MYPKALFIFTDSLYPDNLINKEGKGAFHVLVHEGRLCLYEKRSLLYDPCLYFSVLF